jgi:large subunit ribosomal protein L22
MEVKAYLRFLRMSPRKVRLVVDTIRGLSVAAAETKLHFVPKLASEPVLKLLLSAVANANHNFHLQKEDLYVKSIVADGGPTLKRFRARAFGRAAPIRKRTTHITIVLADKKDMPAKAEAPKKVVRAKKAAPKTA